MAYELKPGQVQIVSGNSESKPSLSVKMNIDGNVHDFAVWQKTFPWGKSTSFNLEPLKALYCAFIKYTCIAVKHYWNEKPTTNNSQNQTPPPRQGGVL